MFTIFLSEEVEWFGVMWLKLKDLCSQNAVRGFAVVEVSEVVERL